MAKIYRLDPFKNIVGVQWGEPGTTTEPPTTTTHHSSAASSSAGSEGPRIYWQAVMFPNLLTTTLRVGDISTIWHGDNDTVWGASSDVGVPVSSPTGTRLEFGRSYSDLGAYGWNSDGGGGGYYSSPADAVWPHGAPALPNPALVGGTGIGPAPTGSPTGAVAGDPWSNVQDGPGYVLYTYQTAGPQPPSGDPQPPTY